MNYLMGLEGLLQNTLVISSEIVLLIILFVLLFVIVRMLFRLLSLAPFLDRFESFLKQALFNFKWGMIFLCFVCSLFVIGYNGYLIYQGKNLVNYTEGLLSRIPPEIWREFGFDWIRIIGLLILVKIGIKILKVFLKKLEDLAKAYEQIKANDESIEAFFLTLSRILFNGIWLIVLIYILDSIPYLSFMAGYLFIAFKIFLIISLGLLISNAISVIVDSLDALSEKYASPDNFLRYYGQLRHLIPLFRRCLEYIVYVFVATLVILQIELISPLAVYGPKIVQIIGIFFMSRVFVVIAELIIDNNFAAKSEFDGLKLQKQRTVLPLFKSFFKYSILFIALILILWTMNINPAAILAGAGIVGIVVGLGAQPLINDLVSGLFILFENIYLVGDFIETSSARGEVEAIDIRTTRVRDPNGQLHILRNGQLDEVINYSKSYTHAVVEVGVAYDSNLEKVYRVLKEAGQRIKETNLDVLEETQVGGLEKFGESELLIRTTTRVKPGRHLEVARQFRKNIKEAFDREGIEIPFARRVLIFKPEKSPWVVKKSSVRTKGGK